MAEEPERQAWGKKIEYTLSVVGYAVGLGNVWRFPYICYKYGGGAFLIPYFIMVVLMGFPVFLIESGLGQFSSQGPLKAVDCVRAFKGLGYAMLSISVMIGIYYNVVLSWVLYYTYRAFTIFLTGEIPWTSCEGYDNCVSSTKELKGANATADDWRKPCVRSAAQLFFDREVQGQRELNACTREFMNQTNEQTMADDSMRMSLFQTGTIYTPMLWCLVITWIAIALCIWRGIKGSGKVMYVITLFPYVALSILLIKGLTLDGALDGISYYVKPVPSKLLSFDVWYEATGQIFYSTSLAMGGVITLCSFNGFRNDLVKDAYIVVLADAGTSIFGGFTIFAFLGYMAKEMGLEVEDVVTSGPSLALVVWPEAMTKLSSNPSICAIFSITFFVMLYFMGVSSMIGLSETIITFILDLVPSLKKRRGAVIVGVVVVLFSLALPLIGDSCMQYFSTWDAYCASYTLIILAFFEVIAVSWCYGTKRFISDLRMMTGNIMGVDIESGLELIWKFFAPVVLVALLITAISGSSTNVTYTIYSKKFQLTGTGILGGILMAVPLSCIVGGFLLKVKKHGWNPKVLFSPVSTWGPAKESDKIEYQHERLDGLPYSTPMEEKTELKQDPDVVLGEPPKYGD